MATETEEQQIVIKWWSEHRAELPERLLFHIPNEGRRSPAAANALYRMGLRAGVPDLLLAVPRGVYHGLFIEMKRPKGSRTSPEQRAFIEALNAQGFKAVVCKGADAAITVLKDYLSV